MFDPEFSPDALALCSDAELVAMHAAEIERSEPTRTSGLQQIYREQMRRKLAAQTAGGQGA